MEVGKIRQMAVVFCFIVKLKKQEKLEKKNDINRLMIDEDSHNKNLKWKVEKFIKWPLSFVSQ